MYDRQYTDCQLVDNWNSQCVSVKFHKKGLSFNTGGNDYMADLMLNMLSAVAQFELAMIQERRQEGIEKTKPAVDPATLLIEEVNRLGADWSANHINDPYAAFEDFLTLGIQGSNYVEQRHGEYIDWEAFYDKF
ncbi:TPA: recombinase family protein [Photobacterium damselae]